MKAHTFSVEQEAGIFKVTVVEMPGEETGEEAPVVKDAAKNVAEGGVIKFDFPHSVGAIYGANSASLGQTGLFLRGAVFTRSRGKPWRVGRRSLMPCAPIARSHLISCTRLSRRPPTRGLAAWPTSQGRIRRQRAGRFDPA